MSIFSSRAHVLTGVVLVPLLFAGCASSRVDAEWTDPAHRGHMTSLRGAKVLVACEAPDVTVRNLCQERIAAQVQASGSQPVFVAPDATLVRDRPLDVQLVPVARDANANAVLVVTLRPVAIEGDRSSVSFGFGGIGFGGGSATGGGIGLSAPFGDGQVVTGFSANGRVTTVNDGRLVWSANASTAPSSNLAGQLDQASAALIASATRAGLF